MGRGGREGNGTEQKGGVSQPFLLRQKLVLRRQRDLTFPL